MLWRAWISQQRTRDVPLSFRGLVAMDRAAWQSRALAGIVV